jgi:pimeloyl-ACP methyl ester carboxylesterase
MALMVHSYVAARPSHTPRSDNYVELTDGRRLGYAEWGPRHGATLLFFHGTPGSRLFCPDEKATNAAEVRFVAFDRPGYGGSDPAMGFFRFPDFVPDVIELLNHLDVDKVAIVGWSGGGRHALAVAAFAPERVSSVGLIASPDLSREFIRSAPPEVFELAQQVAVDPVGRRDLVRVRCQWLIDDPYELVQLTEHYAPEVLSAPGLRAALQALWLEAGRQGIDGYMNDWIAQFVAEVGYEGDDVCIPVVSWFGEKDRMVPPHLSQALAAQIPGSEAIGCSACGHFLPIAHWAEVLQRVARP